MNVLIMDEKSGITMVTNNGNICALNNGRLYSVTDYRPLDGNGRQLRSDSQTVIRNLLPSAQRAFDELKAKRKEWLDNEREQMLAELKAQQPTTVSEQPTQQTAPNAVGGISPLETAMVNALAQVSADKLISIVYPAVEKEVIEKFGCKPIIHKFELPNIPTVETSEILHHEFDNILLNLRCGFAVYLYGPAGTGKSHLAKQLCKVLNCDFWYGNSLVDDIQLKGFIDANGTYHDTQFYHAFKDGGLFMLDELDASSPDVLVMLNTALANGYFDFPTGRIDVNENFYCIAAGNTAGTGADDVYTGRNALDMSTLDRFSFYHVDYDERIELNMCNNNAELVEFIHAYRATIKNCGVSSLATYRAISRLYKLTSAGMPKTAAIKCGLIKAMPKDDVTMICNNMIMPDTNEWFKALKDCKGV